LIGLLIHSSIHEISQYAFYLTVQTVILRVSGT